MSFAVRHYFAIRVEGDASLLEWWPEDDDGLEPIDASRTDDYLDIDEPEWTVSRFTEEPDVVSLALYTRFDFTIEDEELVERGEIDVSALFAARLARVRPIVERVNSDVDRFFDEVLPEKWADALAQRRRTLAARESVAQSFSFPDTWTYEPPLLQADEAPTPAPAESPIGAEDVEVPHESRLSPASFARLQRTIRVWADAIERYPRAFASLREDPISDLLTATLKATLPGADREVFSRAGKSDILVKADVLSDGAAPETVFIAESKWARSAKVVREALDPQLRGYLTVSDTSAILLLLLPQQDKESATATYREVLRGVSGFVRETGGAVEGWPIFEYDFDNRILQVCVATVHCADPKPGNLE